MKLIFSAILVSLTTALPLLGQTPAASNPPTLESPDTEADPDEKLAKPNTTNLEFVERSNSIVSKIVQNERLVDPFGFAMDPSNMSTAPALSDQYEDAEEIPVLNASAFKTAIEGLPISGIYPKRQTVVIGARSFAKGQQFGMKLEELTIRLRVEGIKGSSIYFKDMDTQEIASFDFNPKPVEFEPIKRGMKQPRGAGIVPMDELFIVN